MHVFVLGAGVIGVTTAYYLAERGCDVTVVESAASVASATSFANACQLSYSFTDSLASPKFLRQIPALLLGRDHGSRVDLSPELAAWGMHFLRQCTSKRARNNTLAVLAMALRSQSLLADIRRKLSFDFGYRAAGKLVLLPDEAALAAAKTGSAMKRAHGSDVQVLSRDAALSIEPALEHFSRPFVAATYSASDEVGDARLFSNGLQDYLCQHGRVSFEFDTRVTALCKRGRRITGIVTTDMRSADAVVVCLGAWSEDLLGPVGLDPRIYPVRGYSVTLPLGVHGPSASVSATRERIVYSRIRDRMRIAGFADFQGFSKRDDDKRIDNLLDIARQLAPLAADYDAQDTHSWGGFRPMTPSGLPLAGSTRVRDLYLNTGHGMLGWTLACASAYDTAEAVCASSGSSGPC